LGAKRMPFSFSRDLEERAFKVRRFCDLQSAMMRRKMLCVLAIVQA